MGGGATCAGKALVLVNGRKQMIGSYWLGLVSDDRLPDEHGRRVLVVPHLYENRN